MMGKCRQDRNALYLPVFFILRNSTEFTKRTMLQNNSHKLDESLLTPLWGALTNKTHFLAN